MRAPRIAWGATALAAVIALVVGWRMLAAPDAVSDVELPWRAEARALPEPLELTAVEPTFERANELAPPAPVHRVSTAHADLVLHGRIITRDGSGVGAADVEVVRVVAVAPDGASERLDSSSVPFARVRSSDDGTFEVALVAPAAQRIAHVDIACRRAGFAAIARSVDVPDGVARLELADFVLETGALLQGFVRDCDGVPVADAEVTATNVSDAGALVAARSATPASRTRSSAGGAFTLADAPSGRVELSARLDDGRRTLEPTKIQIAAGETRDGIELVLPLYADPTAILGVVLDVDGTPLAGAGVSTMHRAANGNRGGGTGRPTDERGRFRIQGRPGWVFAITASHPRGTAVSARVADVEVGRHDVVLRLTEPRKVPLRVRGAGGDPVPRFAYRVRVNNEFASTVESGEALATHTGGEIAVAVPSSTFVVELVAPGYASAEAGPFDPDALPASLEATLQPLPSLRGRVVRHGEPVADVVVRAHAALEPDRAVTRNGFALVVQPDREIPGTRTDADGSFVLDVGAVGDWWLVTDPVATFSGPFSVGTHGSTSDIVIDLGPRGGIQGTVRSSTGRPLSGRRVQASSGDGAWVDSLTDSLGRYRFEPTLAPGPWQVRIHEAGTAPTDVHYVRTSDVPPIVWDCRVVDGATARCDVVVPEPSRLLVRIAASAAVFADASWNVRASRERRAGMAEVVEARSGERPGEHVLDLPDGGDWRVSAGVEAKDLRLGLVRTLAVPPGSSDLVWNVTGGSVRGRLRPEFVPEARVQLAGRVADGTSILATIGIADDGAFEFPFAITGRFGLMIDGIRDRRTIVTVTAGQAVDAGEF